METCRSSEISEQNEDNTSNVSSSLMGVKCIRKHVGSLLGLKEYYRQARKLKRTIKVILGLRNFTNGNKRVFMDDEIEEKASDVTVENNQANNERVTQNSLTQSVPVKSHDQVAKLAGSSTCINTVANQVKELVDKGEIVAEMKEDVSDVAYHKQGNIDLYSEENLKRRIKLQEDDYIVALTQRLWLASPHDKEGKLNFNEYEQFMLRLHRLILPEFKMEDSKDLIKSDWERDTDGKEYLDYRFFHLSMFELVDLWTETVDLNDYIALLYCITEGLTVKDTNNGNWVLKRFEDLVRVDISEIYKRKSLEVIRQDLTKEVESEQAHLFRASLSCSSNDDQQPKTDTGVVTQNGGQKEKKKIPKPKTAPTQQRLYYEFGKSSLNPSGNVRPSGNLRRSKNLRPSALKVRNLYLYDEHGRPGVIATGNFQSNGQTNSRVHSQAASISDRMAEPQEKYMSIMSKASLTSRSEPSSNIWHSPNNSKDPNNNRKVAVFDSSRDNRAGIIPVVFRPKSDGAPIALKENEQRIGEHTTAINNMWRPSSPLKTMKSPRHTSGTTLKQRQQKGGNSDNISLEITSSSSSSIRCETSPSVRVNEFSVSNQVGTSPKSASRTTRFQCRVVEQTLTLDVHPTPSSPNRREPPPAQISIMKKHR